MKSTSVTCKATNCVHNKKCDCMAGAITVKGINATDMSETICNTFVEEGGYAYDNLSSCHDHSKTVPEKLNAVQENANTMKMEAVKQTMFK